MGTDENGSVFQLKGITKSFGGLMALDRVDLSMEQGEIVGLIGPNGAGKSTLFNVITSIYTPDAGEILLEGKRITGKPPHRICHLGISRTFQLVKTFLSMTALENVLVGAIYGNHLPKKHARDEALAARRADPQEEHTYRPYDAFGPASLGGGPRPGLKTGDHLAR
jgi:branched-chain amino acid transport system ATP-binding protein